MAKREQKKDKSKTWLIVLIVVLVVAAIFVFAVPLPFEKTELYTETVNYEAQQSHQETVNRDNCDSSRDCVCTEHGGFLWLTCTQCSCTREGTVVKQKLVLKERTVTANAPIFKSWINERISESEAKSVATQLLDFIRQKQGGNYYVSSATKEGKIWKVSGSGNNENLIIEVDSNTGKINYLESGGVKISMNNILQTMN